MTGSVRKEGGEVERMRSEDGSSQKKKKKKREASAQRRHPSSMKTSSSISPLSVLVSSLITPPHSLT